MQEKENFTFKLVMRSGQVFVLYGDQGALGELISHPKFIKMNDTHNEIFVSIEDVAAFEVMDYRKEEEQQVANG